MRGVKVAGGAEQSGHYTKIEFEELSLADGYSRWSEKLRRDLAERAHKTSTNFEVAPTILPVGNSRYQGSFIAFVVFFGAFSRLSLILIPRFCRLVILPRDHVGIDLLRGSRRLLCVANIRIIEYSNK
jgi:hypothetical protein